MTQTSNLTKMWCVQPTAVRRYTITAADELSFFFLSFLLSFFLSLYFLKKLSRLNSQRTLGRGFGRIPTTHFTGGRSFFLRKRTTDRITAAKKSFFFFFGSGGGGY
eukprot:RCo013611